MATHCSILAWEIHGDEHGGLQSTGSQKSQTLLETKQQPVQIKYVKGTFLDSTNKHTDIHVYRHTLAQTLITFTKQKSYFSIFLYNETKS